MKKELEQRIDLKTEHITGNLFDNRIKGLEQKIDPATKFVVGSKEYNDYYGFPDGVKIDPATKFVIGSKEYNDYYSFPKIHKSGRHR